MVCFFKIFCKKVLHFCSKCGFYLKYWPCFYSFLKSSILYGVLRVFGFGKSFGFVSKFFLKSWRGSRLACRLASAGLAGWLGRLAVFGRPGSCLAGRPGSWLAGLPGLLAGCSGAAVRLWRRCCGARGLSFWLLICGGGAAVVRRVPLSGARSPRGWVAGSRLRFVFCVIGFAGFLCGFRFRSFAFLLSKNAVSGRFWVRALSNLCRRWLLLIFLSVRRVFAPVCAFCAFAFFRIFCRFEKLFSVARRVVRIFFGLRALLARRAARV